MKVETKKVITLNDEDKNIIRKAINIIVDLQDALQEEYNYNSVITDLEDIVYHEPWEIEDEE